MKILAIGNSFSDDTFEYLRRVLSALGEKDAFLGNLYIGGCSLERHAENARSGAPAYEFRTDAAGVWRTVYGFSLGDALRFQPWDVVTMQQASALSGIAGSYSPYLCELISYVRRLAPTAKLVWNATWAYQKDSDHPDFVNYGKNQARMYENIADCVRGCVLPTGAFAAVAPCGTAIQNARTSFLGDTLTRDGFHLSLGVGRYIAALTMAETLTGKIAKNLSFVPACVSAAEKRVAEESAENAVKTPFSVTGSRFSEVCL